MLFVIGLDEGNVTSTLNCLLFREIHGHYSKNRNLDKLFEFKKVGDSTKIKYNVTLKNLSSGKKEKVSNFNIKKGLSNIFQYLLWNVSGADPLLQILYETDIAPEGQDMVNLHDIPAVWRYRELISVNHLRQSLDTVKINLPVLQLFLKEVELNYVNSLNG